MTVGVVYRCEGSKAGPYGGLVGVFLGGGKTKNVKRVIGGGYSTLKWIECQDGNDFFQSLHFTGHFLVGFTLR